MRTEIIKHVTLTILATFQVQTVASADDLVKFDNAPIMMGQLQQQRARERGETPPNKRVGLSKFPWFDACIRIAVAPRG